VLFVYCRKHHPVLIAVYLFFLPKDAFPLILPGVFKFNSFVDGALGEIDVWL
jgi:hypothetical protein